MRYLLCELAATRSSCACAVAFVPLIPFLPIPPTVCEDISAGLGREQPQPRRGEQPLRPGDAAARELVRREASPLLFHRPLSPSPPETDTRSFAPRRTPLLGNRQGVPGLAEYLLDLPLVLAPNQTARTPGGFARAPPPPCHRRPTTLNPSPAPPPPLSLTPAPSPLPQVVVVIAAEDAFLQAARPAAGSAAEVTLTDSFLTVAGPAWIGGVTYSVTANCVPRSTRATAAIELEGYAPAKCATPVQPRLSPAASRVPQ